MASDGQNIGVHNPDVSSAIPGEAAHEDGLALPGGVLAASMSFHEAFDLPRQSSPNVKIDESLARLRIALLAGNWSGLRRVGERDHAGPGIQGRPSVSMTRASKKDTPCLAAVDR